MRVCHLAFMLLGRTDFTGGKGRELWRAALE